jgi:regulator of sirC expression with transglutaminase-like and TPR domain
MIVCRILENLMRHASATGEVQSILNYLETLVELDPTVARHRWTRAVVRFELGYLDDATIDVDWLLQTAPEGIDFNRVKELGQFIEKRRREQ